MPPLTVFPIEGVPEVRAGDVLAELLVAAAQEQGTPFEPADCVVVTDTFGRAWRIGLTDVAIGVAGLAAVVDLRGQSDAHGRELQVTEIALADEIAGAAELVKGKAAQVPAAVVRGLEAAWFREGSARELVRPPAGDLFR